MTATPMACARWLLPVPGAAAARGRPPCRRAGAGGARVAVRRGSSRDLLLLGLLRDDVAVVGEFTNERIDLAQCERCGEMALEIATDEAVVGDLAGEGGGTGGVDDRGPVFLDEAEDAENATDPRLAVAAGGRGARPARGRARPRGPRQRGHPGQRAPRRPARGARLAGA